MKAFFSRTNSDLMIATLHVYLGEDLGTTQPIKQIIKLWDKKLIPYGDHVDVTVVHSYSSTSVFDVIMNIGKPREEESIRVSVGLGTRAQAKRFTEQLNNLI